MRSVRWFAFLITLGLVTGPVSGRGFADPATYFDWLKEGTVLVSVRHAAVIPGHQFSLNVDGNGDWIDVNSGLTYDQNFSVQDTTLGETTVLALDGNNAALGDMGWGLEQKLGFPDPVLLGPGLPLVVNAYMNDYWRLPQTLASAQTDASKGILVARCKWTSGKKTFDAVRIQVITQTLFQVQIFDLKSGICMHTSSDQVDGNGDTHLNRIDIFDVRHLNVPWVNEAVPAAVAGGNRFHFVGQVKTTMGGITTTSSAVVDFVPKDRGQRWFSYDAQQLLNGGSVGSVPVVFGLGQFCGMWIGPEAMKSLQAGQVLDNDPYSKMKTVVMKATDKGVEIGCSNSSSFRAYDYASADGTMIGWEEYNKPNKTDQIMLRQ